MIGIPAIAAIEWMKAEAFWGLSRQALLLSLACLIITAAAHRLLRSMRHRLLERSQIQAEGSESELARRDWLQRSLQAAGPPAQWLIWVYGVYLALSVLFTCSRNLEKPEEVLSALAWLRDASGVSMLLWFLFRMTKVMDARLKVLVTRTSSRWDQLLAPLTGRALRLVLPLVGLFLAVPLVKLSAESHRLVQIGLSLATILVIALLLAQLLTALEQAILERYRIDVRDNLAARKVYTQVKVLKKVTQVVIAILTVASTLMVFDSVRNVGASILASAGVASVIVGFAAQRSIAALLAGFQIAVTQPIRLDDVVVVENECGRIEEITLTYVVLCLWDLRRLIVPTNYFLEKPFQNWTRVGANLTGSVILHLDYTVPIQALRQEFERLLSQSKNWDGKVKALQVTEVREHTLEVRILVSAGDSTSIWDLRCELREKLIEYLQRYHPGSLPRVRTELWSEPDLKFRPVSSHAAFSPTE